MKIIVTVLSRGSVTVVPRAADIVDCIHYFKLLCLDFKTINR